MSVVRLFSLIVGACVLGILAGEVASRSVFLRDAIGVAAGRGHLVAIANGRGWYQEDLQDSGELSVSDMVAAAALRQFARNELVDSNEVDRQFSLLVAQFGSEQVFMEQTRSSGLSISVLRDRIAEQLRSLKWLDKQMTQKTPTDAECRAFYESHRESFVEPVRIRASHIFFAAPEGTPPEVVESKRAALDSIADRFKDGEAFPQLALEVSEDEATKGKGGDLGFFSDRQVPADFFTAVEKIPAGRKSAPFRSRLGFHIVEVTERRPSRLLRFEEVRVEISVAIANQRRGLIAKGVADMLARPRLSSAELAIGPGGAG